MKFLLERLASADDQNNEFDLRLSITSQIQRLVSSCSPNSNNDIDILDFDRESIVDAGTADKERLQKYARQLSRVISRYEPRLLSPSVRIEAGGDFFNTNKLVVNGSISETDDNEDFYFELPLH